MRKAWALQMAAQAAWAVLRQNRSRSILTLAICGLGTAGVIVAGVLGKANVAEMQDRLHNLGGNLIVVSPNKLPPYPGRPRQLEHFISLEPEDAEQLTARLADVLAAIPVTARNTTIRRDRTASRVRLIGTTPDFAHVRSFALSQGRFLQPADNGERVVVVGHAVSQELPGLRPEDTVALAGQPYTVVGVIQQQGVNFAGEDEDHQVFIPLETYRQRIANRPWLSHLYLQLSGKADSSRVMRDVQGILRERHGRWREQVDDVVVRDFAELSAQQTGLMATAVWAISAISGLLLLLGVAGIASLMLLVVRQRRGEIGLRRAVGATPTAIAMQFFLEGIIVTAVGVLVGLLIGLGGTLLARSIFAVAVEIDGFMLLLAIGISIVAGTTACLIPAIAAARLDPAVALRS